MTTPGITSGVVERVKPLELRPNVVWRFEGVLGAGSTITTPIFDVVADGNPLNEVELASFAIVRIPTPRLRIYVGLPSPAGATNPGGVLNAFEVIDNGGLSNPYTYYVQPVSGSGASTFRYSLMGRRCQFRLANTPLGPGAAQVQTYFFYIVSEG